MGENEGGRLLDEHTIRVFLETTYPRLVVAVALASGSYEMAEDAVQEALVQAWARSEKGEEIESLPAWVATVALNLTRKGFPGCLPSVAQGSMREPCRARSPRLRPAS